MATSLPDHVYRALADDYQSGMSLRQISAKHGFSLTPVKTACAMFGVSMRRKGAPVIDDPARFAIIRAAIEGGMSQREARRQFNASEDVIRRSMGLPEANNARRRELYRAAKAKRAEVNKALADEVDAAMERDRNRLRMLDDQRRLRMAA